MAKRKPPDKSVLDVGEGEAIVLVGQPGAMRGAIQLQNTGEERVVFRGAEVRGVAAPAAKRLAKAAQPESLPLSQKLPAVIVRPGERRRLPLKFALSPNTPPGQYQAEIQLEDHTWPVLLHVTEKVALEISPSRLVLHNQPGATFNRQVVLSNLGNVPVTIEDMAAIPLDDELLQCRLLRAVVADVGDDEEQTIESLLTKFAHQGKAILAQAGLLRVRNRTGRITLEPGQISAIDLEFRLPDSLDKRTRYRALVPILTSDLEVILAPAFDPQTPEKTEKTTSAAPVKTSRPSRGKATPKSS